jgi:hypothetical protein
MSQIVNEVNDAAKTAWTQPTIESYDLADFTLADGNNIPDAGADSSS